LAALSPPPEDSEYTVTKTARMATALKAMTQRLLCNGASFSAIMSLKSTATGRVVLPCEKGTSDIEPLLGNGLGNP
jgi:hypothetical protein